MQQNNNVRVGRPVNSVGGRRHGILVRTDKNTMGNGHHCDGSVAHFTSKSRHHLANAEHSCCCHLLRHCAKRGKFYRCAWASYPLAASAWAAAAVNIPQGLLIVLVFVLFFTFNGLVVSLRSPSRYLEISGFYISFKTALK